MNKCYGYFVVVISLFFFLSVQVSVWCESGQISCDSSFFHTLSLACSCLLCFNAVSRYYISYCDLYTNLHTWKNVQVGKIPLNVAPHNSLVADKWQSCEIFSWPFFNFSGLVLFLPLFLYTFCWMEIVWEYGSGIHCIAMQCSAIEMYAIYQCVASKWLILSMPFENPYEFHREWGRQTQATIDYLLRMR